MASSFLGLLILLLAAQVSASLILVMLGEPMLLAWLNQIFLGIHVIAVTTHLIVKRGTRHGATAEGGG